jgi:hypothetical protein
MTREEEITKFFNECYEKLAAGLSVEHPNTELKRQWPNLSKSNPDFRTESSKFVRELAAIANNCGPWNGYLIVGLESSGIIIDAPFKDSGLRDESELQNLIVRSVSRQFSLTCFNILTTISGENKSVTVIEIPRSTDKPHVMYEYATAKASHVNYVPVKKGSRIDPAGKFDLDAMYFDNMKSVPEYALDIKVPGGRTSVDVKQNATRLEFSVTFENYGRKPLIVKRGALVVPPNRPYDIKSEEEFNLENYSDFSTGRNDKIELRQQPIVIPANSAKALTCIFQKHGDNSILMGKDFDCFVKIEDVHGNIFKSKNIPKPLNGTSH